MRPLTPKEKVIKEAKSINFDRVASTDFKEFLSKLLPIIPKN